MKLTVRKVLAAALVVVMLLTAAPLSGFVGLDFGVKASALDATGQCGDNVYWAFDSATGTLTISGTGEMQNDGSFADDCSINTVIIEPGVTSIGNYAFYFCYSLTSVSYGNSVPSIGTY